MKIIKLNEENLMRLISECVKNVLTEDMFRNEYRGIELHNLKVDSFKKNIDWALDTAGWSVEKTQAVVDSLADQLPFG